ncbi:MAG: DUF4105 domain-containing protein [Nitrospinota bacterium]
MTKIITILPCTLSFIFFFAYTAPGYSESLAVKRYLPSLIHEAKAKKLNEKRFWHLLLHYKKNIFGAYRSEEDGPDFFAAPDGKTNPSAELSATLESFFKEPQLLAPNEEHPQCIFPARYAWLKSQLSFDNSRLIEQKCDRLEGWLAALDPEKITMVFASYYMNNPASMFGHTLLRIDKKQDGPDQTLLNYGVNYAAPLDTKNPFIYAFKAIFGMYPGNFSLFPYYTKVQKYSNWESRDLWEYELTFTQEQMRYLLLHLWELGGNYFSYYYFRENCSYHILSLLEIADPKLHLTDHFFFSVIPSDTIKILTRQKNLVSNPVYRPSLLSQMKNKIANMTDLEKDMFFRLIENFDFVENRNFSKLSSGQKALILDTYLDFLQHRKTDNKERSTGLGPETRRALSERSKINSKSPDLPVLQFSAPPEKSHGSARIGFTTGTYNNELFQEISFRPAYHDLLAIDTGYSPHSQILFSDINIRFYDASGRVRLDKLSLIDIISLPTYTPLFKNRSWKFSAAVDTIKDLDCNLCNSFKTDYGMGLTNTIPLPVPLAFYSLLTVEVELSPKLRNTFRAGGGVTAGVLGNPDNAWRFQLKGQYLYFPVGHNSDYLKTTFAVRRSFNKDLDVRLQYNSLGRNDQFSISINSYF